MLKNYLLITYRNLTRNREYSIINIAGLAISISSCLMLFYMLRHELSFDTAHANRNNIYRVVTITNYTEGSDYTEGIPAPLPEAMRNDFPELKGVATIMRVPNSQVDIIDEHTGREVKYKENEVYFAEPQFFDIFSFKWLHGAPDRSLLEPNTAVLTQATAEKYFGDWKSAIGKTIQYHNTNTLKVTGILENIPYNSDFPLQVVISFSTRKENNTDWGSVTNRRQCYLLLDDHTSAGKIQGMMAAFKNKHYPEEGDAVDQYRLQPLRDIHFDELYGNYNRRTVSKTTLLSLALIGVLLLVTAAINFVNLAIAQVIKKSKEVGVRKVLGSNRHQLSLQFYGETFFILVLASCLSVGLSQLALPFLGSYMNLPPGNNAIGVWDTVLFIVTVCIVLTALAGFYPAMIMAGFKPVQALKSKISSHTIGGVSLRKGLVVVQFVIAQVLVIATLIVLQQLEYFRKAPLGFDKDAIMLVSLPTDSAGRAKAGALQHTLQQLPGVTSASFNFGPPLSTSNRGDSFNFERAAEEAPFEVNMKYADTDYFKTYNLSLAAGRLLTPSDTPREYVVNRTFLAKLGINNPEEGLGKLITNDGRTLPIVGVMNDFHLRSLQSQIEPLAITTNTLEYGSASLKLEPGKIKETLRLVEKAYASYFPETIFEHKFLDEDIARQYEGEARLSVLTNIFSCMAIFISCLGLYGLISFMTVQRTKEVGVRKVLGASMPDILGLFYKEFTMLVLIAFVVAAPAAWYAMSTWLNGFAYRIDLNVWTFALAITLSLLIALVTVSFRSVKAALANPVDALRNE